MTDTPQDDAVAGGEGAVGPSFALQRIYVKDISFESPRSPEIFRGNWKPRINLDLNTRSRILETDVYEVILTLSIEASAEDEQTGFIVELQQAGVFHISGLDEAQLQHTLASYCPNLLFPYARETVDSLVMKGSFPPLMLAPVNFDALYAEAMERQKQQGEGGGAVAH